MLNTILIAAGAAVFVLSFWKYVSIIRSLEKSGLRTRWIFLFLLTLFFLAGYVMQILTEQFGLEVVDSRLLIAAVYFFGAVYVLLVVSLSLSSMRQLRNQKEKESGLRKRSEELEARESGRAKELESSKRELEKEMQKLEQVNRLAVGRELKMVELKKRLKAAESGKAR